jgi:hypothetical protein
VSFDSLQILHHDTGRAQPSPRRPWPPGCWGVLAMARLVQGRVVPGEAPFEAIVEHTQGGDKPKKLAKT